MRPSFASNYPREERAQGMPGARCTRSLACENKKAHEVVTTSSPEQPGIPRAMVLTAYFEISPVIGLFVTVACEYDSSAPGRADFAPQNLTPASRRQDHTTSPSATAPFVCAPVRRSRVGPRPEITTARRRCRVHRIPCPTSVTIAKRPSFGTGWARHGTDLRRARREIFLQRGLDHPNQVDCSAESVRSA